MSTYGDWCVSSVDRFFTLYWSPSFSLTMTHGLISNLSVKAIATTISIAYAVVNFESLTCRNADANRFCQTLDSGHWTLIPFIATLLVILSVTGYVIGVIVYHEKKMRYIQ